MNDLLCGLNKASANVTHAHLLLPNLTLGGMSVPLLILELPKVLLYHWEATAQVDPFTPDRKLRETLYLGKEARAHPGIGHPDAGEPESGAK